MEVRNDLAVPVSAAELHGAHQFLRDARFEHGEGNPAIERQRDVLSGVVPAHVTLLHPDREKLAQPAQPIYADLSMPPAAPRPRFVSEAHPSPCTRLGRWMHGASSR
jgi:hypothetical protein